MLAIRSGLGKCCSCLLLIALNVVFSASLKAQNLQTEGQSESTSTANSESVETVSLTDRELNSTATTDWSTEILQLNVSLTAEAKANGLQLIGPADPLEDVSSPTIAMDGDSLMLSGEISQFLGSLASGTRSLWLQGGDSTRFRVDLPVPTLKNVRIDVGNEQKGPIIQLLVEGLLPGFEVFYSAQPKEKDGESEHWISSEMPVVRAGLGYPRIGGVERSADQTAIQLRFSHRNEQATALHYYLTVVNPDGSRSRTLRLTQTGETFTKEVAFTRDARSLPVDKPVDVPLVELLDIMEAQQKVRDAGMVPIFFDLDLQTEVPTVEGLLVLAQGIPGGAKSRLGEALLMAVRSTSPQGNVDDLSDTSQTDPVGIVGMEDPVGPLGIVDTDTNPLGSIAGIQNSPGQVNLDDGFNPPVDDGTFLDIEMQSGINVGDSSIPGPMDDQVEPATDAGGTDVPAESDVMPSTNTTLPISSNTGVNLDPNAGSDQALALGVLKVVLAAVLEKVNQGQSPGTLGQTIAEVINLIDDQPSGASSVSPVSLPIESLMKTLGDKLGISLTDEQISNAATDWKASNSQQADLNRNGKIADDVAVWMIAWLTKNGHYNPATHLQVVENGLGKPLVLLSDKVIEPGWVHGVKIENGVIKPAKQTDTNGDGSVEVPETEKKITIPAGKSLVKASNQPSHIRVPANLKDRSAAVAVARIRQIGLKAKSDGKVINTDKVVDIEPAPGRWVRPDDPVKLLLMRSVPKLTDSTAEAAKAKLEEFELKGKANGRVLSTDFVSEQSPAAGEYVRAGSTIQLIFKRKVPGIEGKTIAEANQILTTAGFQAAMAAGLEGLPKDVVLQQKPPSESNGRPVLGDPSATIQYTRIGTRVPDLTGGGLRQAKSLQQVIQILDELQLKSEMVGTTTKLASARVIEQQPAANELIDRTQGKVSYSVVIPVPKLAPRSLITDAVALLNEHELRGRPSVARITDMDVLMSHQVTGRTYTDGTATFVPPGTEVALNVGRPVPRVDGFEWKAADAALKENVLQAKLAEGYPVGGFIHHTKPAGGELIDPRQAVVIFPGEFVPDVRGKDLATAERMIREAGLTAKAERTPPVENDEMQGQSRVITQLPQSTLVLKSTSTIVTLRVTEYVGMTVLVPEFKGSEQQSKVLAHQSKVMLKTRIRAEPTFDRDLDGIQQVTSQNPLPGTRVKKDTFVDVAIVQYIYQTPAMEPKPLITYAKSPVFPDDDDFFEDNDFLCCSISPDRQSVKIEHYDGNILKQTFNARLTPASSGLLQTTPFSPARLQLSIPVSGDGAGIIEVVNEKRGRALFSLQRPLLNF